MPDMDLHAAALQEALSTLGEVLESRKFYAAVDQGPRSKHAQDLRQLGPTRDELRAAARWARTHDTSDGFRRLCSEALAAFGVEGIDDL